MSDTIRKVGADESGSSVGHYKRKLKAQANKATATYTREGDRDALWGSAPEIGDTMETIDGTPMKVTEVDLDDKDEGGGAADLIVSAESVDAESSGSLTPLGDPTYEVNFQELRRKIESHPCCGKLHSTAATNGHTFENWWTLEDSDWIPATDIPTFWSSIGPWTLAEYKSLKREGVEEFPMYLPVITRTQLYLGRPNELGEWCGTQSNPPVGSYQYISKYEWLRGPDNLVRREGKFERKTSWMAAEKVSALIYPDWT